MELTEAGAFQAILITNSGKMSSPSTGEISTFQEVRELFQMFAISGTTLVQAFFKYYAHKQCNKQKQKKKKESVHEFTSLKLLHVIIFLTSSSER